MRQIYIVCLLAMLTLASLASQASEHKFVIGYLKKQGYGAGCTLTLRNVKSTSQLIFEQEQTARMNINNQDVELKLVKNDFEHNRSVYRFGDALISVDFGKAILNEAGAQYDQAIIKITRNGKTRIILAEGGCGC